MNNVTEKVSDGFLDNQHLIDCMRALLDMDAAGALVPYGIDGHARALLEAAIRRLEPGAAALQQPSSNVAHGKIAYLEARGYHVNGVGVINDAGHRGIVSSLGRVDWLQQPSAQGAVAYCDPDELSEQAEAPTFFGAWAAHLRPGMRYTKPLYAAPALRPVTDEDVDRSIDVWFAERWFVDKAETKELSDLRRRMRSALDSLLPHGVPVVGG